MVLKDAIEQFTDILTNTREYAELKAAKTFCDHNPKMNELLLQFGKKQETLYTNQLSQAQREYVMNDINGDYEKLSAIPEINRYFQASDSFGALMNEVVDSLHRSIEARLEK